MRRCLALAVVLILVMGAGLALAQEETKKAIEKGKALFNDPKLGGGTTGLSCNSCHPAGKTTGGEAEAMGMKIPIPTLIGAAATFPKFKMGAKKVITADMMNNMCIMTFLKGKPLALDSDEAVALSAYVHSLSEGKRVKLGAGAK